MQNHGPVFMLATVLHTWGPGIGVNSIFSEYAYRGFRQNLGFRCKKPPAKKGSRSRAIVSTSLLQKGLFFKLCLPSGNHALKHAHKEFTSEGQTNT